jgi:hypothetical protein
MIGGEALFAYGSLASPESIGATLGRAVEPLAVARLAGWRRRGSLARDNLACEKTFARADDGTLPRFCLGLNIEVGSGEEAGPNGVLYELSEDELRRLDVRELRYDRVEVGDGIEASGFERVHTYTAKPAHFAATAPAGAVILAHYALTVQAAFAALGADQLELFRETTGPHPVEVVEGVLVSDEIPAGNPRSW